MAPTAKHAHTFCASFKTLPLPMPISLTITQCSNLAHEVLMCTAGITPMRTMALEFLSRGKPVVLLYGSRTQADAAFLQEFKGLAAAHPGRFSFVFSASKDNAWTGRKGRIDKALIAEQVHIMNSSPSLFPPLCNYAIQVLKDLLCS